MTRKRSTKRALLLSALSMLVCVSMLVGSTFAWFTDSVVSGRNRIVSGNLDVVLEYKTDWADAWTPVDENTKLFKEGALYEPGYTEVVYLRVSNAGSLALKYNLMVNIISEKTSTNVNDETFKLSDYLQIGTYVQDEYSSGFNYADILMPAMFGTREAALSNVKLAKLSTADSMVRSNSPVPAGDQTAQVAVLVLTMPETVGNEANHKFGVAAPEIELGVSLVATQYTDETDSFDNQYDKDAEYPVLTDTWDGTADTTWYNDTDAEFTLTSAEQLAGLAELVNTGTNFEGKTVKLDKDVDLSGQNFTPIGGFDKENAYFAGTFDGNNHTISGLTENGWDLGYEYGETSGMGLFGVVYNATIKDVNIDNAEIAMEAVVMGVIAGYANGDCTFEGINVTNTQIANYNWDTGGIVGQVYGSGCTFTFKDIVIDESTTISGHWGTWDVSAGGVIGRTANGVNVIMEDVTVAATLDVYNDVCAAYQWYAYRYSGMLVGYTKTTETVDGTTVATAPHVTCKNVTVIYDDWANYTYCQASNVAPQYVRVQGGYSTDPYYSGRHWTAGVDAAGNKMVDDNHVHADGEAHNELIVFDQLFGGGQGVYGTATHEGVTVIYNNK